MQLSGAETVIH